MPLEFLNTGYGARVKEYILSQGRIRAFIRFDCEKDVFPDATTSIGIILFEKTSPGVVSFYVVRQLDELETIFQRDPEKTVRQSDLRPCDKWFTYFESSAPFVRSECLIPIATYGTFSRGIATGANEFFVLRPSQVAALGLSPEEVAPCITKSCQVKHPVFTNERWFDLVVRDAPVYLLNVRTNLSRRAAEYIRRGERSRFNQRYLTRMRKPWYRIESRLPSPILLGVFSRDGYKVVRNYTGVLNLTCFHGFQPNLFGREFIDHLFLYLLSAAGRRIISLNMRKYGDCLDKFEPNDLNQAFAPNIDWFSSIDRGLVEQELQRVAIHGCLSAEMECKFSSLTDTL